MGSVRYYYLRLKYKKFKYQKLGQKDWKGK